VSSAAPPFQLLDLAGTPEEIGFAHGRRAADHIAGFLEVGLARLNRYRSYSREEALLRLDPSFRRFGLLIRRRLRGGPTMLGFSWPGLVGYVGLNSAGVGVCVNQLVSPGWRVGVPAYFVSRRLLEQDSAPACREVLAGVERGSSPNWLVADSTGSIVDFETTALRHVALEPTESVFAHTNHYLDPDLATEDRLEEELPDSPARRSQLAALLNTYAVDGVDVAGFERSLQDHQGFPQSICRHADGVDGAIESVVSAVFDLSHRQMHVALGPPCGSSYSTLGVEGD
jgi:isopenicillin-N N-acyltransferase like protein